MSRPRPHQGSETSKKPLNGKLFVGLDVVAQGLRMRWQVVARVCRKWHCRFTALDSIRTSQNVKHCRLEYAKQVQQDVHKIDRQHTDATAVESYLPESTWLREGNSTDTP